MKIPPRSLPPHDHRRVTHEANVRRERDALKLKVAKQKALLRRLWAVLSLDSADLLDKNDPGLFEALQQAAK